MATGGFPVSTSTGAKPETERPPILTTVYDDCSEVLTDNFLIYRLLKNLTIARRIRGLSSFLQNLAYEFGP
jgi:hypothetical protein